jgi:hypothetical protein
MRVVVELVALRIREGKYSWNALESPGKRHVRVIVHPIGAEVESVSCLRDASTKSLLGILETQRAILAYERPVDVVDVLSELAVAERRVKDHHGASVYDKANLSPERTVQLLGEIR